MSYEFYMTIEGKQQGKFQGELKGQGREGKIAGIAFSYDIKSPRDAASGLATGKRQHGPVIITKEWGAATPQIFQALVENENLRTVLLEFMRTNAEGVEEIYQTIKLASASVTEIRQYSSVSTDGVGKELEDISFTFSRIEISNLPGKTIADDDWMMARS
jgi:type VI secretion system secreted protein Hcp